MKLSSPSSAMLWELWRVTRVEAAWKLAFGIGGPLAVLTLGAAFALADSPARYERIMDDWAAIAMILLVLPHFMGWRSLTRLNGGRPGFPLYLHYTRPVRTAVIVGLPMVYLTAVSWAIYLVSALLLRVTSGFAFPLLPVAVWMAALALIWVAATWSTRNSGIQVNVIALAAAVALFLSMNRLTAVEIPDEYDWPPRLWPTLFDWPLTDYAWVALIGLASVGVAVAGVTRQRRGDGWAEVPSAQRGGSWDWHVDLFRFRCPTSSATRAQVWFDSRSTGLPLLSIGVALAIVILLLGTVAPRIDAALSFNGFRADVSCPNGKCWDGPWRLIAALFSTFSPLSLLFLGANAFGIRGKQGRSYVSAFEMAQASGTAQLAALKLFVRSACFLAALLVVGVSAWTSLSILGDDVFIAMWSVPLSSLLRGITGAFAALTGYEQLALVVVAAVGVVVWAAAIAVLGTLWTRYSRRATIAVILLALYGLAFVWLAAGVRADPETASQFHLDVVYGIMRWIAIAAMVFTTAYVFWRGFAERVLTIRFAGGAVAISAAFAAAWLTMLHIAGVQLAGMSAMNAISVVSPALLPLMASGLAPWSLSRIRHT